MNSQLYAHLEAYDDDYNNDDEDLVESESLANEDRDVNSRLHCDERNHQEDQDVQNITSLSDKSLAFIPVGVFLFLSLLQEKAYASIATIATMCVVLMRVSNQETNGFGNRRKIRSETQELSPVTLEKYHNRSVPYVYECRKEVSRLLGLIGAPPMQNWKSNDGMGDHAEFDSSVHSDNLTVTTETIVEFLEAHVQLILMIDKALYWIKISAGLHWGLGPHSQGVERVERAAMSKSFLKRKTTDSADESSSKTTPSSMELPAQQLSPPARERRKILKREPQQKVDLSSILALSSARRNVAQVIVQEVESLIDLIRIVKEYNVEQRQQLQDRENDRNDHADDDYEFDEIHRNALLIIPEVIDLAWMKASRKYLASLLTYTIEQLCTRRFLVMLSSIPRDAASPSSVFSEYTWSARNLREYLASHLLLDGDESSVVTSSICPIGRCGNRTLEFELISPILQYRKQLDALTVALWSFSQTVNNGQPVLDYHDSVPLPNERNANCDVSEEYSELPITVLRWWKEVQEISSTCQTIEQQINTRFFVPSERSSVTQNEEVMNNTTVNGINVDKEARSYETPSGVSSRKTRSSKMTDATNNTKTLVFSGKGSKAKRQRPKTRSEVQNDNDSHANRTFLPLPMPRDPFSEQLLVRELQNRIRAVAALREEVPQGEDIISPEGARGVLQDENSEGEDDRAVVSPENDDDESCVQESMVHRLGTGDESLPSPAGTMPSVRFQSSSQKREAATSIFLGASGSLLDELKLNIGANNDLVADVDLDSAIICDASEEERTNA